MYSLVANPYFQIGLGAVVSLGGSFLANLWFSEGVRRKGRSERHCERTKNC